MGESLYNALVWIISFLHVKMLVSNSCSPLLANLKMILPKCLLLSLYSHEFLDIFIPNLNGMTPDRDVVFCIYLKPGTHPISISS